VEFIDNPRDKLKTGMFAFIGAAIGATFGILAYVNDCFDQEYINR